jgi:hypothetical protein
MSKATLDVVRQYIDIHHPGSILLSTTYKNNNTKLDFICENNHNYSATWANVQSKYWCMKCSKINKKEITDVINYIDEHHSGAVLLSTEYVNAKTKMEFVCEKDHPYSIDWDKLSHGYWCSTCSGNKIKSIDDVLIFLKTEYPRAILITKKYKNNGTKLRLICEASHTFSMSWQKLAEGHWCAKCSGSKGEEMTRKIFEDIFNKPFPTVKPKWLINPKTNYLLQLDGFNEELRLAFEYDGLQHYKFPNHYHRSKKQFLAQQERDRLKDIICKDNNVKLIRVKEVSGCKPEIIKNAIVEQIKLQLTNI